MRIILSDFMSLDGVVQAPGGKDEDTDGGGWSMPFFDPEAMGASIDEVMARADAPLFGRRTRQVMAGVWPGRAGDPFADPMNAIRKYVASRTLSPQEAASRWNNTALLGGLDGDAIAAIRSLSLDESLQSYSKNHPVAQKSLQPELSEGVILCL